MSTEPEQSSEWETERDAIHNAVAQVVHEQRGEMLLTTLVIVVTVNDAGEKLMSCWTSPDQRQWESIGLLEYVRMNHGAHLAERRIVDQPDE
jgi:hypothetical protein